MDTAQELSDLLDTPANELRRLAFGPNRYRQFTIPKRRGGVRLISAPHADLAAVQRRVLQLVLCAVPASAQAHGFVPGRSIVTAAGPHVRRAVVLNVDIHDFFPSITEGMVRAAFRLLGHGQEAAKLLACLCTEPCGDGRCLPQGACTSPVLSNAVCARLDRKLAALSAARGFVYTRYADDLSFSGGSWQAAQRLFFAVRRALRAAGFEPHPKKVRFMSRGGRQRVTGLAVNDKPSVPRAERRRLRAILHNVSRHGLVSENWEGHDDFAAHLRGKVAFVTMADPTSTGKWLDALSKAEGGDELRWLDELIRG